MTLDRLFLPFAESKTEFERLKKAPGDNAWIEVEAKLRHRLLPDVQSLYVSGMEDLQDAIQELQNVLALDNKRLQEELRQSKGPAYKSSSLVEKTLLRASYRWEQYKFSIGSTERAKAFGNVEQQLDRLAKLLVENDETAEIRALAVQSWSRNNNFWRHAQAAYNLISRSWCCTCQADHCADLALLQHSTVPVHLDVDFLFSQDADTTDGYPWRRLTTRISKDDRKLSAAVNTAIGPGKLALNTKPQFTNCPMFQKVSHSNPPDVLPRIADLCYEMSGLSRDDCWLGLLADQY
ncbi:hypothetical protein D6D27_08283, partial [Aureobasidium pullulans]